jgi:hypothetical protein
MSTRLPSTIVRRRRGLQPPPLSVGAVTDKILVRYKTPFLSASNPLPIQTGHCQRPDVSPLFRFRARILLRNAAGRPVWPHGVDVSCSWRGPAIDGWPHGVDLCCRVPLSFVQMSVARMFSKLLRPTMARINPVARRAFGTILCFFCCFFFVLNY